jgi:glycerol kinase
LKGKKIFSSQSEFKSLNEIKYKWKKNAIFKPKISQKLRNNLLHGWQQAIRKTLA